MTTQEFKSRRGLYFGEPVDPRPLDSSRLYPPRTYIYLFFDYRATVYQKNTRRSHSKLFVRLNEEGQVAGKRRLLRTTPFEITGEEGTGFIGFGFGVGIPRVDANREFSVDAYSEQEKGKEIVIGKSDETFKLKISIDGEAIISETQLEAIKAMYRRLELLEERAKALESRE